MFFPLSALRQSKTVRTIVVFSSGNVVAMLLGLVGSLVQARYVGPEDMGVFRTFGIVAGYLTFLHMGVFDGLQREIPMQLGRGNQAKAERAASACLAWIMFVSLVCGVLFLGLALRAACHREWMQFWGWLANTPLIVMTFYGTYLGTTFRTGQQFIALSKISVIQAVAGTVVLPLLPIMGYYGACLRTAVTSITNIFSLHCWRPIRVRLRFDWASFLGVIRIGLPLSGIGYINTSLWISVEGTLVLTWFGAKALGLYSVAVFIRTIIGQLVQNISQVLSVKICERYGRSNSARDALRHFVAPVLLMSLASLPLIAAGWMLMPWLARVLIPRYVEATFLMQIFLIIMPMTILKIPTAVLWVAVKLVDCFISVIIGFVAFVTVAYFLYRMNFGLPGVAVAFIIGQVIYLLAAWILTLRLVSREYRAMTQLEAEILINKSDTWW
jgi:O-antigen/teichoic acid export membrane protein